MTTKTYDLKALVDKLEPDRLTKPRPEYVFSGRIIKTRRPTKPGETYEWAKS